MECSVGGQLALCPLQNSPRAEDRTGHPPGGQLIGVFKIIALKYFTVTILSIINSEEQFVFYLSLVPSVPLFSLFAMTFNGWDGMLWLQVLGWFGKLGSRLEGVEPLR